MPAPHADPDHGANVEADTGVGLRQPQSGASAVAAALARLPSLRDVEAAAHQRLPAGVWAYLNAGAADGLSASWNARAFDRIALLPRVLRPAGGGSTALQLHGRRHAHPLLIAPTAFHALAHPEAERATALAAAALQTPYVVSTQASVELEAVAAAAHGGVLWFQLYWQGREVSLDLLRRAERAGYQALMLTVDAPIQGLRHEDQRRGFAWPAGVHAANLVPYAGTRAGEGAALAAGQSLFGHPLLAGMAGWDDVAWLAAKTRLPLWLKGVLNPDDVQPALDAGVAGLVVSNHGGRALDSAVAVLDALPDVVAAVGGRVPVLADGGIRRGTDVLKALALGADAVLIGRPVLHGLALAGAPGVAHVLNLLRHELEAAMVLAGCRSLAEVRQLAWRRVPC